MGQPDMVSSGPPKQAAGLRIFTRNARLSWCALSMIALASELIPMPGIPPALFYSYKASKALIFLLLGFVTPLCFWRFDSLGLGLLFSIIAAGSAELVQTGFQGHRSSYVEFFLKLLLLLAGFAVGLNARYDRKLQIGSFCLRLFDSHWTAPD